MSNIKVSLSHPITGQSQVVHLPCTTDELTKLGITDKWTVESVFSNFTLPAVYDQDLQQLNYMAAAMMDHSEDMLVLAESYTYEMNTDCAWHEWVNLLEDIGNIDYYSYETPNHVDYYNLSVYAKFGYTLALNGGLYNALEEYSAECHFDFYEYGEYNCDGYVLLENGYYYANDDSVAWSYYTIEEIEDMYSDYKLVWDGTVDQFTQKLNMLLME